MDALVHFAVGLAGGLLVLTLVDSPPRREVPLAFASGIWALLPDGHWMLVELGLDAPAPAWRALHRTAFANLFWFHRWLDLNETGRPNAEGGLALLILIVAVGVYYVFNDWDPS